VAVSVWYEWRENEKKDGKAVFVAGTLSPLAPFANTGVGLPVQSNGTIAAVMHQLDGVMSTSIAGRAGDLTHPKFAPLPTEGEPVPQQLRPPVTVIATGLNKIDPATVQLTFSLLRPRLRLREGVYTGYLVTELQRSQPVDMSARSDLPVGQSEATAVFASQPLDPLDLVLWLRSHQTRNVRAGWLRDGDAVVECDTHVAPTLDRLEGIWLARSEVSGSSDRVPGIGKAFKQVLTPPALNRRSRHDVPKPQSLRCHRTRPLSLAWVHTEEYGWDNDGKAVPMFPAADAIGTLAANLSGAGAGVDLHGGAMLGRFAMRSGGETGYFGQNQSYQALRRDQLKDGANLSDADATTYLDSPWPAVGSGPAAVTAREELAFRQPSARQIALSGGLCVVEAVVTAVEVVTASDGQKSSRPVSLGSAKFFVRDPADVLALTVHAGQEYFLAMRTGGETRGALPWLHMRSWLHALRVDACAVQAGWCGGLPKLAGVEVPHHDGSTRRRPAIAILGCDVVNKIGDALVVAVDPAIANLMPEPAASLVLAYSGTFSVYQRPRFGNPRTSGLGTVVFLPAQGGLVGLTLCKILSDPEFDRVRTGQIRDRRIANVDNALELYSLWASILAGTSNQLGMGLTAARKVDPRIGTERQLAELADFLRASTIEGSTSPFLQTSAHNIWDHIESLGTPLALAEHEFARYLQFRYAMFAPLWLSKRAFRAEPR
jgi:hypothetical protein